MKYRIFLSAFFLILLPVFGHAEYRVFLLKISRQPAANATAPAEGPGFRLVESTLDHEQYRFYNEVAADEQVTYIDTWRCYGRTDGFAPHCPNPRAAAAPKDQIPSTENSAP